MLWKFDKVYNPDRQYAEHQRDVKYQLPAPAETPVTKPHPKELYVHAPLRSRT
jgi:magnesium-protoporphyrin IX monomethyl ester (oxidative) cyclase